MTTRPASDPSGGWTSRLPDVADTDPADSFEPHDGARSDYNQFAADLHADPDPAFDPMAPHAFNKTGGK